MGSRTHRRTARLRKLFLGSLLLAAPTITFSAFTVTEIVTPTVGTVLGGASSRQFALNTDDTVTGADAADYLFGALHGELQFNKTQGPAAVNIVAENITTSGGLTVNGIPCAWRSEAQTVCDGAGIDRTAQGNRTLHVGVDFTTSQIHSGGDTASVSFDITVNFL